MEGSNRFDQPRASLTRSQILSSLNLAREKDLKARTEELEEAKSQLEQERTLKQKSEKQVSGLQQNIEDVQNQLARSQEVGEKLRAENRKKTEQVERLERNISQMEDRIRNLEIRASEVEKAELTLESTRRNLETSQHECRTRDNEIARLQVQHDQTCLQLEQAKASIQALEKKITDLKHQVRHELMKNENIEKGLETIPLLKDELAERDQQITQIHKDMDDKTALLVGARKAVRQFKDRIRDLEREGTAGQDLRRELEMSRHEVSSLKHLLAGKDVLLNKKRQALDQVKTVMESSARTEEERDQLQKIKQLLTHLTSDQHYHTPRNAAQMNEVNGRGSKSSPIPLSQYNQEAGCRAIAVDATPYHRDSDYTLLERCLQENHLGNPSPTPSPTTTARTAVVHPIRRSSFSNEATAKASKNKASPRIQSRSSASRGIRPATSNVYRPQTRAGSRFPPSLDYALGDEDGDENEAWACVAASNQPSNETSSDLTSQSSVDTESDASSRDEVVLAQLQLSFREKDALLRAAIAVGDRVTFTVQQKPPRYGRKKPKPLVYTGIVKYMGHLDKEQYDARLYCGVRLDEPVGEQDGVYKGKRYMITPLNHAKFFKLRDVTSVLDVKSGQYVPASRLLIQHWRKNQCV